MEYCAEEDRREEEDLEGVILTPPEPCKEFIETLRSNVGVEDRECWLIELGDRLRGLLGGSLPFGDELELVRCRPRAGESSCRE